MVCRAKLATNSELKFTRPWNLLSLLLWNIEQIIELKIELKMNLLNKILKLHLKY